MLPSGSTLTVTLLGDSAAFYPAVLRMLPDGRWERLQPKPGSVVPAELLPGKKFEMAWPDARPLQSLAPLVSLQPVMVRYFEADGVSFGQIAFFHPPPVARETLKVGYADGSLVIEPPATSSAIRATWVLWPQEEGIAPIQKRLRFEHEQPAAQRIEWRPGARASHIDTGRGQPEAVLLHETAQGYFQQTMADGGVRGRQQRAAWLEASATFYGITLLFALAAMMTVRLHFKRAALP